MDDSILDVFMKYLLANYQNNCAYNRKVPDPIGMVEYMMAQKIVKEEAIRHYVISLEFLVWTAEKRYRSKTRTVEALAERYGMHVNSIWNILRSNTPSARQKDRSEV